MISNPFTKNRVFASRHAHLAIGGSVACYKACDLLRLCLKAGLSVSVSLTEAASRFVSPLLFSSLGASPVYAKMFSDDENPFIHLEPGQIGGVFAAVPATADMLFRFANGSAGDLVSCQALAFDGPRLIAPAMNPAMWKNPATQANLEKLAAYGWLVVMPGSGPVACGETGKGRLAEQHEIFLNLLYCLAPKDMAGKNVVVTIGPTREYWDSARFWSNPSSGRMGAALATAAWLRGANVHAVCGPGFSIEMPDGVAIIPVENARQMFMETEKLWPKMNLGMFCAAVADFRPKLTYPHKKVKKLDLQEGFSIKFCPNPDILATLAQRKSNNQKLLGFAAECVSDEESLIPLAELKLKRKKIDILAANRICGKDNAFASDSSVLTVVDSTGKAEIWASQSKADAAWELCSWLLRL